MAKEVQLYASFEFAEFITSQYCNTVAMYSLEGLPPPHDHHQSVIMPTAHTANFIMMKYMNVPIYKQLHIIINMFREIC